MQRLAIWGLVLSAVLIMVLGCEEVTDEEDTFAAQALSDSALGVFEDQLAGFIEAVESGQVNSPGDIDFTTSLNLFEAALERDQNNLDANFGAGLTKLLVFFQDAEVNLVFDTWDAFLDTGSIFDAGDLSSGSPTPIGLITGLGTKDGFQLLNKRNVAGTYLNLHKLAVSNPPTIGDIQEVIQNVFIPALKYVTDKLEIVDDSTNFTFTVTPAMQGGGTATYEIDLTEIYLMEVGVNFLLAMSNAATAYNLGPAAYDSIAIIDWLSQGSGFMSLRPEGASRMALSKSNLMTAATKLDAAADFLLAETDDQTDDIVTFIEGEFVASDIDSIHFYTQEFRDSFDEGITFTIYTKDDSLEVDEDLTIDFDVLFTNSIVDFKSILPAYEVSVGRDTGYQYQWIDTTIIVEELIINPFPISQSYWFYLHYEYYDDWDSAYLHIDHNFPEIGIDYSKFYIEADSLKDDFLARGNIRHWEIRVDWNQTLLPDSNDIVINVWTGYDWGSAEGLFYTGIITFAADSAAEWIFQVENFNGLVPQFTTDAEFKRITGFRDSDFEKVLIIPFDFGGDFNKALSPDGFYGLRRSVLVPWAFVK